MLLDEIKKPIPIGEITEITQFLIRARGWKDTPRLSCGELIFIGADNTINNCAIVLSIEQQSLIDSEFINHIHTQNTLEDAFPEIDDMQTTRYTFVPIGKDFSCRLFEPFYKAEESHYHSLIRSFEWIDTIWNSIEGIYKERIIECILLHIKRNIIFDDACLQDFLYSAYLASGRNYIFTSKTARFLIKNKQNLEKS